jgi:exodeoxyribonuclease III
MKPSGIRSAAVRIATWNINSIAARLPLVLRWLESARPDVLCLQELKCTDDRFPPDFADLGYETAVYGQPTYNGVAIISKFPIEVIERGFPGDDAAAPARLIAGTIEGVRIVNVYIPNGSEVGSDKYAFKLDWLARLRTYFDSQLDASNQVLLCGDFNVAPEAKDVHDPKRWEGKVLFSEPERGAIETIRAWGLVDAYRSRVEDGGNYSWWDYRMGAFRRNWGLRIDHIWVTPSLAAKCTDAWIDKETRAWERPTDHAPVIADFS